jgi:excinuclease ABC subunit A
MLVALMRTVTILEKMVSYSDEQIKDLNQDFSNKRNQHSSSLLFARKGHYGELFQQIARILKVRVNGQVVDITLE